MSVAPSLSPEEQAQKARFEAFYAQSQSPVLQSIGRHVCGCDHVGNSWTTLAEADAVIDVLGLRAGARLLDIGAGSGWPGLHMARRAACDLVMVDLPENGLRMARGRADRDGIGGRVNVTVADAASLPFGQASFDAITHSDLLCCLVKKRDALHACRRVVRRRGRMAFTVISVAPGLSAADRARAVETGPDFVDSDADYAVLLARTGWTLTSRTDLSPAFERSFRRQIEADEMNLRDLRALLGERETAERGRRWRAKLAAVVDGLLVRELFVATPVDI